MNTSTPEKRKRYKEYVTQSHDRFQAWCDSGYDSRNRPISIPMPEDLIDLPCGARTKATGKPCKQIALYANGRCKFHGGCSTGPLTEEGKSKSALNGFKKHLIKTKVLT